MSGVKSRQKERRFRKVPPFFMCLVGPPLPPTRRAYSLHSFIIQGATHPTGIALLWPGVGLPAAPSYTVALSPAPTLPRHRGPFIGVEVVLFYIAHLSLAHMESAMPRYCFREAAPIPLLFQDPVSLPVGGRCTALLITSVHEVFEHAFSFLPHAISFKYEPFHLLVTRSAQCHEVVRFVVLPIPVSMVYCQGTTKEWCQATPLAVFLSMFIPRKRNAHTFSTDDTLSAPSRITFSGVTFEPLRFYATYITQIPLKVFLFSCH